MKKLFLIRHAKSSHDDLKMKDIDRTLNNRGKEDAPMMGKILKEKGVKPDLIFSSPAVRALETAKFFSKELNLLYGQRLFLNVSYMHILNMVNNYYH